MWWKKKKIKPISYKAAVQMREMLIKELRRMQEEVAFLSRQNDSDSRGYSMAVSDNIRFVNELIAYIKENS